MWLSKQSPRAENLRAGFKIAALITLSALSACTVEPLNATRPDSKISSGDPANSIAAILASTTVKPVDTRQGQQVRNNLLFAMNGGHLRPSGNYGVTLTITTKNYNLSIQNSSLAPTSAQVAILASYQLYNKQTGKIVLTDKRRAQASYDKTAQSFANERALRDAENRAAKEIAQQIKLSIAQHLADL